MKIYIAAPYSAKTPEEIIQNVNTAIDVGIMIYRHGHIPYIPHLAHWIEQRNQEYIFKLQYEDYLKMNIEWLKICDALLYLAPSPGADQELQLAKELKKQIYYDIRDIPFI